MSIKNFLFLTSLALFLAGFSQSAVSQVSQNQSQTVVHADQYTDDQLLNIIAQAEASNLSDDQLVQAAMKRGLPASEIQKFQDRIEKLRKSHPTKNGNQDRNNSQGSGRTYNSDDLSLRDSTNDRRLRDTLTAEEKADMALRKRIFGANIFTNKKISFEPNLRLATPPSYQIGPDDEILIDIYGHSEVSYKLIVSPEGSINVPSVGVIQVSGMTVAQASVKIKSRLSKIYTAILSGQTSVNIAIGNIRTIKVIITGQVVAPGTYSLSSLATVANALYTSGGPTVNGSFRQIKVIRGGKNITTLDIYDFLINGFFKNDIHLQDQDVIMIPPYLARVELTGQVKTPGLFEMLPGEKFSDLLRFANGFKDDAYRSRVKVFKATDTERKIIDLSSASFSTYEPGAGDAIFVNQILNRFTNRVSIKGAVFRPGEFELEPGLTLSKLIAKAEGLREDAFKNRGSIIRLKDDLQPESVPFDIGRILSGQDADIPLKREDVVNIASTFDLKEDYTVEINGEVQFPDTYKFAEGMNVEDLIVLAGNLKESATASRIDISRRVKNSNALSDSASIAEVFTIDINPSLKAPATRFILQPFDIVSVRASPGYEVQRNIRIDGEVLFPGGYTLTKKDDRVSDLIKKAGGFTAKSYPEGASLRRQGPKKATVTETNTRISKQGITRDANGKIVDSLKNDAATSRNPMELRQLYSLLGDSSSSKKTSFDTVRSTYVGIDLPKIMKNPGGRLDIFLEDGDILNIPKQLQTVKVNGQVLSPRTVVYSKYNGVRSYISSAGGFAQNARKSNTYVQYANGSIRSTRRFLFFAFYPPVKPGAEIFVPTKDEKRPLTAAEIVGLTSGLASLGAIILGILNLSKN